jgi:hypothetical protein
MNRIRKHLNTTIAPSIHDDLRGKSEAAEIPIGTLLEDAWLFFKGTPTPLTLARRQMLFGEVPAKAKRAA